jgi:hypothetical protein
MSFRHVRIMSNKFLVIMEQLRRRLRRTTRSTHMFQDKCNSWYILQRSDEPISDSRRIHLRRECSGRAGSYYICMHSGTPGIRGIYMRHTVEYIVDQLALEYYSYLPGRRSARLRRSPMERVFKPEPFANDNCCICLAADDLTPLREFKCCMGGHGFHALCVEAWIRAHDTCPVCRKHTGLRK